MANVVKTKLANFFHGSKNKPEGMPQLSKHKGRHSLGHLLLGTHPKKREFTRPFGRAKWH